MVKKRKTKKPPAAKRIVPLTAREILNLARIEKAGRKVPFAVRLTEKKAEVVSIPGKSPYSAIPKIKSMTIEVMKKRFPQIVESKHVSKLLQATQVKIPPKLLKERGIGPRTNIDSLPLETRKWLADEIRKRIQEKGDGRVVAVNWRLTGKI